MTDQEHGPLPSEENGDSEWKEILLPATQGGSFLSGEAETGTGALEQEADVWDSTQLVNSWGDGNF